MSKLSDRIRKVTRVEPAPLGFALTAGRGSSPTMLCVVSLSAGEASKALDAAAKGADAVIIDGADARRLKDAAKADGLALGVKPQKAERAAVSALREAGADFTVIDPEQTMAEALLEEEMGYVLAVQGDPDDTTLRQLGEMGLDALIVPPPAAPLTVSRLLALRRIASLARTPLLTPVAPDTDGSTLQVLRECGVAGVILPSSALGKLQELVERIAALPPRGHKREAHREVRLPAQAAFGDEDDEDDD